MSDLTLHDYQIVARDFLRGRDDLSWDGVHYWLAKLRGQASEHPCVVCGSKARDWAYQHNAEDEKVDPLGQPYSLDLNDYSPMCRSCHKRLDFKFQDARKAKEVAVKNLEDWRAQPGVAEHLREHGLSIAAKGNAMLRRCNDCGHTANAGNLAQHLKRAGHEGWKEVVPDVQ